MRKRNFKKKFLLNLGTSFLAAVFIMSNAIVPQNYVNALPWSYDKYSDVTYSETYSGDQGTTTITLSSGNYKFDSVTVSGQNAYSFQSSSPAVIINGTVHMYIFGSCRFTGGNGYGSDEDKAGSAGIQLEYGNTLYIHGPGDLTVKGGNAANGSSGSARYGGSGGTGAGAGIGTWGGKGGSSSGASGYAASTACGDVYLLSTGSITINGGSEGSGGSGAAGNKGSVEPGGSSGYGGYGGGGGGGGGYPGADIGTGGGGGGAGGDGGSSVTSTGAIWPSWNDAGGSGGGGGGAGYTGGGGGGGGGGGSNHVGYTENAVGNGGSGGSSGRAGSDGSAGRDNSKGGAGGYAGTTSSGGSGGNGGKAQNAEDNGNPGSRGGNRGNSASFKAPYKGQNTSWSGSSTSVYSLDSVDVTLSCSKENLQYSLTDSKNAQLTATVTNYGSGTLKYTWYRVKDNRETKAQEGSSNTYKLKAADVTYQIKVKIEWASSDSAHLKGTTPSITTDEEVTFESYPFGKTASVSLSDTSGAVGDEITATINELDNNIYTKTTKKTYKWYRNIDGNNILIQQNNPKSDMTDTYTLVPADIGCDIKVIVTAKEHFSEEILSDTLYCSTITVKSGGVHDYTKNEALYEQATSPLSPETIPVLSPECTDYGYVEKAIAYGKSDITVYLNDSEKTEFKKSTYDVQNQDDLILFSIIVDCDKEKNTVNDLNSLNMSITQNINTSQSSKSKDWKQKYRPLGVSKKPYTGTITGNSKTISNLTIENENSSHVGFVGIMDGTNGGTISDLTLQNCTVTGKSYVGAFLGFLTSGKVNNCYTTGDNSAVTGSTDAIGGIAGAIEKGSTISKCSASGNVTGNNVVGGIVGDVYDSNVIDSSSSANVSATSGTLKDTICANKYNIY